MRLFGAVVMIAGMVWLVAGCGSAVARIGGGAISGLVLSDSVTASRFSLSVVDGTPSLTEVAGSAPGVKGAEVIDSVTGGHYSLAVTSGALTLAPDSEATEGVSPIWLADTLTTKTYELAVVSGALTLVSGEQDAH